MICSSAPPANRSAQRTFDGQHHLDVAAVLPSPSGTSLQLHAVLRSTGLGMMPASSAVVIR